MMGEKSEAESPGSLDQAIFLIDDEADVREVMENFLKENGYDVEAAAHGEEALEKLATSRPQLILLDVNMPRMDGLELLSHLKKNRYLARIPVIMLTARGETTTIMRAQELGAADFITKPFVIPEFLATVRKYVS